MTSHVPLAFGEAIISKDASVWEIGIDAELSVQRKNETWKHVPRAEENYFLPKKWILKEKEMPDSSGFVGTPNAKLVARGFSKVHGLNY